MLLKWDIGPTVYRAVRPRLVKIDNLQKGHPRAEDALGLEIGDCGRAHQRPRHSPRQEAASLDPRASDARKARPSRLAPGGGRLSLIAAAAGMLSRFGFDPKGANGWLLSPTVTWLEIGDMAGNWPKLVALPRAKHQMVDVRQTASGACLRVSSSRSRESYAARGNIDADHIPARREIGREAVAIDHSTKIARCHCFSSSPRELWATERPRQVICR